MNDSFIAPLFTVFGVLFGAAIGSFLNVVVLRTHIGKELTGRSECPHCHHILGTNDLVPILSFVLLHGKCRYCQHPISAQYPLVEATAALAFGFIFWNYLPDLLNLPTPLELLNQSLAFVFMMFFTSVLIVVSTTDLKWGLIPDKIILPASLVALAYQIISCLYLVFTGHGSFLIPLLSIASAVGLGAFFFVLIVGTGGRGMGGGDLKLAIFIGLSLTWSMGILGVFLAFLTGAFVSVMLILLGQKKPKQTIPFGPFLGIGAFIASQFGEQILRIYLRTLGL